MVPQLTWVSLLLMVLVSPLLASEPVAKHPGALIHQLSGKPVFLEDRARAQPETSIGVIALNTTVGNTTDGITTATPNTTIAFNTSVGNTTDGITTTTPNTTIAFNTTDGNTTDKITTATPNTTIAFNTTDGNTTDKITIATPNTTIAFNTTDGNTTDEITTATPNTTIAFNTTVGNTTDEIKTATPNTTIAFNTTVGNTTDGLTTATPNTTIAFTTTDDNTTASPLDCEYRGQIYSDGDIIVPEELTEDCSGCQQRFCQEGVIMLKNLTNCSIQCCPFNDELYHPDTYIQNACARLVCQGNTGQFRYWGVDYNCRSCKAYLDPHIVTFDSQYSSYSYQDCGNYSLTQFGSSYEPTVAVFATFVPCGGMDTLTCVDTVTFKNDEHTIINVGYENNKIVVNGENYVESSSLPNIVQAMNANYSVMAWQSGNCLSLQGSSGILVRFCGSNWANQVYVWSDYDVASEFGGLCGTVNGNVNDDFQTRDGNITSAWTRYPSVDFPLSWLASNDTNGDCGTGNVRVNRETENRCNDSSVEDQYHKECETSISNGYPTAESDELQVITNDCLFDLCRVSDPEAWIQAVNETVLVQAEIEEDVQIFDTTSDATSESTSDVSDTSISTTPIATTSVSTTSDSTSIPTVPTILIVVLGIVFYM